MPEIYDAMPVAATGNRFEGLDYRGKPVIDIWNFTEEGSRCYDWLMSRSSKSLEQLATGEDAGRSVDSFGPDWDAAIEYGVDVMLLLKNVTLSPAKRVAQMDELNCLAADIQGRTVPVVVRDALADRELAEKQRALDPDS